jgi:3-polyprenyl-4-hydroxybenzoate decarboxylase
MRGHIRKLEAKGLLKRVERVMSKDTEIHPLVRWQYRGGLRDSEQMGFLFENVVDAKGRRSLYPSDQRRVEGALSACFVAQEGAYGKGS